MTLKDDLMEIQGIGDARAETILSLVDEYADEDCNAAMDKSLTFFDRDKPEIAESVIRDYVDG
jgi:hypothetical protein